MQYNFDSLTLVAAESLFPFTDYFRANTDDLGPFQSYTLTDDCDMELLSSGGAWDRLGVKFTNAASKTLRSAEIRLKRVGSPGGRVRLKVYGDSGGLPNDSDLKGTSRWIRVSEIPTLATWLPFLFFEEPTLTAGTYHLSLEADGDYAYASSNYLSWRTKGTGYGEGISEQFDASWNQWFNVTYRSGVFQLYENALFY